MKKNKILLLVETRELAQKFRSESNVTFLFPVKGFCVGFNETIDINDIKEEGFIFVNRILDNEGIEAFRNMIKEVPKNIKGIVFDDIGVLNVLKEEKIELTKILFLNHFNCNYLSINEYLEYVDSVVVSSDITTQEIEEILLKANKPLVLYTFGHINIMYSRRSLLTNYYKHFNVSGGKINTLEEEISKKKFKIVENDYGTVIYTNEPFNGLALRNKDNVLYNLINSVFLSEEEISEILSAKDTLEDKYPYKYLSDKETVFKLSDIKE